jgi:hypothetical protein
MKMKLCNVAGSSALILFALPLLLPSSAHAQMVAGTGMPGFDSALGLRKAKFEIQELGEQGSTNVLWPGERLKTLMRFVNKTSLPLTLKGHWNIVGYSTKVPEGDIWVPHVSQIDSRPGPPISLILPPSGAVIETISTDLPNRFGGYGLVAECADQGAVFAGSFTRTVKAESGRTWQPTYALDMPWPFEMCPGVTQTFLKLGVRGSRMGASYTPTTSPNFENDLRERSKFLDWAQEANVSVMLTIGAGSAPQPLGRTRPWLNPDGTMIPNIQEDYAWLPEYDPDFRKWVKIVCSRFGYPKGPVNAVELWNEPWEGVSISGWGADIPRYREMYRQMALGVIDARKEAGVKVLIGGASSSSNTLDKLFPDGSKEFLPYLDFVSIHYQGLGATPCLVPEWMDRKGDYGRVKVWDTESWVGNSEDRVPGVVASMRSFGQDRAMGIYGGNVYTSQSTDIGVKNYRAVQSWPPAAAVAAAAKFVGQREFKGLVFPNGLPWVYRFSDPASEDDSALVVLGELGTTYNPNGILYRHVQAGLASAPGLMVIKSDPTFRLLDCYGNVVSTPGKAISIPLSGQGMYLRTDGSKGSFARLMSAVAESKILRVPPVEIVVRDFLGRVPQAKLRLSLTNVLNRTVRGRLVGTIGGASLEIGVDLLPNQTVPIEISVPALKASPDNLYALEAKFISPGNPVSELKETLHSNVIAYRSIPVDGDLSKWTGVLPHSVTADAIHATVTEKAWLPFKPIATSTEKGLATAMLAYDDHAFYFAARIHDTTPYGGNIRFANRDDDSYYYPEISYSVKDGKRTELRWPAGVRRFTYRKNFQLPSGIDTDNVLVAFNVLPPDKKYWRQHPPGVMPHYMNYPDTDYEYALNQVAPAYGGGTEVWRLLAPGMPRKHFYSRQPKAPNDGGPVPGAKLVIKRDAEWRYVEASLPWDEIPDVHRAMIAGKTIKFSFRVNDNKGPSYELAQGRSVSKTNYPAFHDDWQEHWANEVEFAFEPKSRVLTQRP